MRRVWVFRDRRSGSTAFTHVIANALGLRYEFINSFDEYQADPQALYNTHSFDILGNLKVSDNPLILRCTRKDKTEQVLSSYIARVGEVLYKKQMLQIFTGATNTEELLEFSELYSRTFAPSIGAIDKELRDIKKWDNIWNEFTSRFDNQTFYYEDITDTFDIPNLGMYNISVTRDNYTKKLPYNKRDIITNYDAVKEYISKNYP